MSNQIENLKEQINWHWRNSMRTVRFFNFDARAALPFCLLLVYARLSTLILAILSTIIFYLLERQGLSTPAAMRNLRSWLVGRVRPGLISVKRKRFIDYG